MQDLFEHAETTGNAPEFTVSELSGAVKRVIEGEFGRVRVRGEVGRVSRPNSGHVYFNLKDQGASLDAVSWRGQVGKLSVQPEEGLEVIATGRMTTFPGQSKYQLIVEELAPAGMGALMAMLEKRKAALQAEGLFDPARKKDLPYLPEVIAVVTSPSGAVIRDILHRLRDRFPRRVMIWPVPVQGAACAPAVAAAIRGLNALPSGRIPRPDLIIVARGGGSVEDLWGFNEEIVVRAAAESDIPLISAVGHETDTTLIDYAADWRAPTPTAAAERAVPVRIDLIAWADGMGARLSRALTQGVGLRGQRLRDLSRALPRPETLVERAAQRLDQWGDRLPAALRADAARKRERFLPLAAHIRPRLLRDLIAQRRDRLEGRAARLAAAVVGLRRLRLQELSRQRQALDSLAARLQAAPPARLARLSDRLAALDRTRQTLGYTQTLRRGYAVVRAGDQVVTTRAQAEGQAALEIEFQDGRLSVRRG